MTLKPVVFFILLGLFIIIPTVNAQEVTFGEKAEQKSIKVVIDSPDKIHVKHVIASSNLPKQMDLINGYAINLKVSNESGEEPQFATIGDNSGIMIFPSQEKTIVEYDLSDVIVLKDNVYTWNFRYLESTAFYITNEDVIFVNSRPVYILENDGILCHGCEMVLEYMIDEPKILENIKLDNKEFLVEIRTFAEINQFNFDELKKNINFQVNGEKQFVTSIIPLELLPTPYNVMMIDEKIPFYEYNNNGTHVWLTVRPDNSGSVSISSTIITDEKLVVDKNSSTLEPNVNQDIVLYVFFGIIILVVIALIIMRKKKSSLPDKTLISDNT
ncbi:MAG: hypothetical protein CK527_06595 [Nitrosarchaeum sp.]|nr:MAG: hypothetical protein CK527_06595 [Nitrosarchaeum sp.]